MHIEIYNIMSMHFFSKSKINTCGVVILHLEKQDFFHNVGLNCPGEKYLLIYFISVMICLYLMRYWLPGMRSLLKKKKEVELSRQIRVLLQCIKVLSHR